MSVPSFSDLGKSARDIFKTGYHYGKSLIKLTSKKIDETIEMNTDLSLDRDAMKVRAPVYSLAITKSVKEKGLHELSRMALKRHGIAYTLYWRAGENASEWNSDLIGIVDVKYKTSDYGRFLQKWSTDGTVLVGYLLDRTSIPDTGLVSELKYNPSTAAKAIRIGANCNKENFNALCSISSDMSSNVDVLGAVVTAFKGFTIGYQGGYSSEGNKIVKNNVEMAFTYRDVDFHFRCISIPSVYGLSLQYKVNSMWDAAIDSILAPHGNPQRWVAGAALKYKIDENSTFRCKFNNDLQLGMSLQQKLDKSVTVFLSCNVDCVNVTRGGHKVGLAVEINA
ncbi:non-selective voltage-gated ion channel VDAC2-like [Ptiloglossa arizonensis]|uniref:non-selective voltage-gated ion channel VDAC2-like n=1 Tax=Ptiloglossa arizonensis TaxID=3350558 RepID=UPI003F9F7C63